MPLIHDIKFNEGFNYGLTLTHATETEINSSWEELTDTARLVVPRKVRYVKDGQVITSLVAQGTEAQPDDPYLRRGDRVTFSLGYGSQVAQRFAGYVSNIAPRNPLAFEFQDEMYLQKQVTIQALEFVNETLETILFELWQAGHFTGPQPIATIDMTIGRLRITRVTPAELLQFLRQKYGLISYYRGSQLYVGVAYRLKDLDLVARHEINLEMDTPLGSRNSLTYQREDDQRIKVRAISIYPDNTTQEYIAGDSDGGERTLYFYDVSQAALKTLAEENLAKLKYTGWIGGIETFLNPHIQHGDAVKLTSDQVPDANGDYLVKRVITHTSVKGGGRQVIELDTKIT